MARNQTAVQEGTAVRNEADVKLGAGCKDGKGAGKAAANSQNAVASSAAGTQEKVFPPEVLRANCVRLFGCTSSTFDGAFFDADREKECTVREAAERIRKWEGKEIDG